MHPVIYFFAASLYRGRDLGIILSPRTSIEGESFFEIPELILGGRKVGIFQVPKPIGGVGGYSSNASGKMKGHGGNMTKYEGKMKKYEEKRKRYEGKMKNYEGEMVKYVPLCIGRKI